VAVPVVDRLEAVEVEEEERKLATCLQACADLLEQPPPVGETGERVDVRQVAKLGSHVSAVKASAARAP